MTTTPEPLPSISNSQLLSREEALRRALESRYSNLRTAIQVMVARSGLAEGQERIAAIAEEVLHDVVSTALDKANVFDPARSQFAWFLGIAVHKLQEKRRYLLDDAHFLRRVEGPEAADGNPVPAGDDDEDFTGEDRLDTLLYHSSARNALEDTSPEIEDLLALVDENDRQVLRLAVIDGLSGVELAAALGIREGAAYVRVARAKERLRKKYLSLQGRKDQKS